MGVLERRRRERAQLRDEVLGAVRRIAADDGWSAVTMRRVAEAVEWSPPKLYQLFPGGKDAMVDAVRVAGWAELVQRLASVRSADPMERLVEMAATHLRFADEAPEMFRAMYGLGGAPCPGGGDAAAGATGAPALQQEAFAGLVESIAALLDRPVDDPLAKVGAQAVLVVVYGAAALALEGQIPPSESPEAIAERSVRLVAAGLLAERASDRPGPAG